MTMTDEFVPMYFGKVRVEMDRTGKAYVRFVAREMLADGLYANTRKICKKYGFTYDGVNAHVGPSWKLASLVKHLRTMAVEPIMGSSVAYEMGRLASAYDYGSAAAKADARMDAIEAATGKKYRDYQREDARWMEAAGSCILANEMRTGKTPTCLAMVPPEGAVVVSPANVKQVWVDHVREWLPWMEPTLDGLGGSGRITVLNYERLPKSGSDYSVPPGQLLVGDEAQMLKNLNAGRSLDFFTLAGRVLESGGRVILASGTPAINGRWQEFWALLQILRYAEPMFGNSRTFAKEWRDYYSPHKPIVGPLSRVMTRRTYKEVVGYLPPFTWSEHRVTWEDVSSSSTAGWTYDEDHTFAQVGDEVKTGLQALWDQYGREPDLYAALNSNPRSIGEYSRLRAKLAYLKAPEVTAWAYDMAEAGVPCLVTSAHREAVVAIAASLNETGNVRAGLLVGGMSDAERDRVKKAFQDGELDVLCFTLKTGGVGIDLSRAEAIGVVDLSFVPGENDQAFARLLSVADPQPKSGVRFVFDHPLEKNVDRILSSKSEVISRTVGKVGTGGRTLGQDILGDLDAGVGSNGAPPDLDLDALNAMLKNL